MNSNRHSEIEDPDEVRNTKLKDEICDMKTIVKNATAELQKLKLQSSSNNVEIKELNEKVYRLTK